MPLHFRLLAGNVYVLLRNRKILNLLFEMGKSAKMAWPYRAFKAYVRFYHDKVNYKRTYVVGTENVPERGTPLMIVSNHQNGSSDPLGIVMSFRDRKVNVITRADVFAIHPVANWFLRAIGLLPAFRINHEGEEALGKNAETFKMSEKALLDGETVVMYPEAGHQDKHWLGNFSYGYTRLAFEAAEMGNFEKEIFILPSCNHYDDYFGIRNELMIRYGKPISLKPYYELYKTKPRTAQREVNKLVREQISSMMLDIRDLEHYDAVDFLRETYGLHYAQRAGVDVKDLPEHLESDKRLVAAIADIPEERRTEILSDAEQLRLGVKKGFIRDSHFDKSPCLAGVCLRAIATLALFPLWVFCLYPGIFMLAVAKYFSIGRMKDRMMESTFLVCLSILFWIPLFSILTFVLTGIFYSWIAAAAWVILLPAILIFAWGYAKRVKILGQDISWLLRNRSGDISRLRALRERIYSSLDSLLK